MSFLSELKPKTVSTKRRYIYETLRDQILTSEIPPRSRIPATHALCEKFGVSYITMHSALGDLVRDGLLVRHSGKGTFTADNMDGKKRPLTSRLVMVIADRTDIERGGYSDEVLKIIQGATQGASASGAELGMISLPTYPTAEDNKAAISKISQYDGALFVGLQHEHLMPELRKRDFPLVCIGAEPASISTVVYDRPAAILMAAAHLIEHGYKKIGYLGTVGSSSGGKYEAFCRCLAEQGIVVREEWVRHAPDIAASQEDARALLRGPSLPEAIFVDNQHKALAFMMVARERGVRIPEDVAVFSYNADTNETAQANLSMVVVPFEDMGREGAVQLDRLIRGALLAPAEKVLPPRLAIRSSCGCKVGAAVGEKS